MGGRPTVVSPSDVAWNTLYGDWLKNKETMSMIRKGEKKNNKSKETIILRKGDHALLSKKGV